MTTCLRITVTTNAIGAFPIYIFQHKEPLVDETYFDPMNYMLVLKDHKPYRAYCQNIPCEFCDLQAIGCEPKTCDRHIADYVTANLPELFI